MRTNRLPNHITESALTGLRADAIIAFTECVSGATDCYGMVSLVGEGT